MDDNLRASVIICCSVEDSFLEESINSVLQQTYKALEIIVINSDPSDRTKSMMEQYGDRIRMIPIHPTSIGTAIHSALNQSQGEIVCFLESHDVFLPNKIAKIVNVFRSHHDAHWCFHRLRLIDHRNRTLLELFRRRDSAEYDIRNFVEKRGHLPIQPPSISGLCFRRSLLKQLLPLPEHYSLDVVEHCLKFTAIAISRGFWLEENLACNRPLPHKYHISQLEKFQLDATSLLFTAYWLRIRFPKLKRFANNLFAKGMSHHWQTRTAASEQQDLIHRYLTQLSVVEKVAISSKAFYRYFLPS
jgi:glycosyltransferase involved in cell wall biosynthesis